MKVFLPIDQVDKYHTVHFSDPTFDAVAALEEIEHILFDVPKHDCVSSCVLTNWDKFPLVYEQFRARVNFEKRENFRLARGGVLRRPGSKRILPDVTCVVCGNNFRPASRRDKFCSQKCSAARFVKRDKCKSCGIDFMPKQRSARNGYCSKECGLKGRTRIQIAHKDRLMTLQEWSIETGISAKELRRRKSAGWSVEKMLSTPVKRYCRRS